MSRTDQAMRLAKAGGDIANLRRENDRLRKVVAEFSSVLTSASNGRDLHCGFYVAKEYNFTTGQLDRLKAMVRDVL